MATSDALRDISRAARPLIEQALDIADQIAALRNVATEKGLDWSQLKALLKAQIQDERDETGEGKRVKRVVEKAEFASAYADMLGLAIMNENNFSQEQFDAETGEITNEPAAATETAGDYLREPATVVSGQIIREGDAPRGTDHANGDAPRPDTDFQPLAFLAREDKPFRPNCQRPDNCAGQGNQHCYSCRKAMAEADAVPA